MVSVRAALAAAWECYRRNSTGARYYTAYHGLYACDVWVIDQTWANRVDVERYTEAVMPWAAVPGTLALWPDTDVGAAFRELAQATSPETVRAAICIQAELAPWLLHQRDPIQERLERVSAPHQSP